VAAIKYGGEAMMVKQGDELFIPYAAKGVSVAPSSAAKGLTVILCNPAQVTYELRP